MSNITFSIYPTFMGYHLSYNVDSELFKKVLINVESYKKIAKDLDESMRRLSGHTDFYFKSGNIESTDYDTVDLDLLRADEELHIEFFDSGEFSSMTVGYNDDGYTLVWFKTNFDVKGHLIMNEIYNYLLRRMLDE